MRNDQGIPGITRRVNQTGGVAKCRLLAVGPGGYEVSYPTGPAAENLFGVTLDKADNGRGVTLQNDKFAQIETAGPIPANAEVMVDNQGRVSDASSAAAGSYTRVGKNQHEIRAAGAWATVDISHLNTPAL